MIYYFKFTYGINYTSLGWMHYKFLDGSSAAYVYEDNVYYDKNAELCRVDAGEYLANYEDSRWDLVK